VLTNRRPPHAPDAREADPDLIVRLESPLPDSLPAGVATAIFCSGTCFHRRETVDGFALLLDGKRVEPAASGMPRVDLAHAYRPAGLEARSYRSGFWATVPIRAIDRADGIELAAAVRLASGRELVASLGRIDVVAREPAPRYESLAGRPTAGLIAICMATYEPDLPLFETQVESLRGQSHLQWICLLSDDCSSGSRFADIQRIVAGDERFVVSRSPTRLGFYRNFERALRMVPAEAELVALCDQDDFWHPDKLEVLRKALGSAQLVYSDQRLVDADGRVLSDTLWRGRRNNHTSLASMLVANTVTGAASLFRREVAELTLPFPDTPGLQFHDHWLGAVALAAGDVAYVDRPLYDYVQHPGAVFGKVGTKPSSGAPRRRMGPPWRGTFNRWRSAYFLGYLAREVQAQTLSVRCPELLTARKRRDLDRYIASARSPLAFLWLATRTLRSVIGRNETLGSEAELARGVLWRVLIERRIRRAALPGRKGLDASFPTPMSFEQMGFEQKRLRRWRARMLEGGDTGTDW